MSKPTYYELLKHPMWQRKRLEILQRANFACEDCGEKEKILHVHHGYYEKGLKPWEYPDESLHALCESCHVTAQDLLTNLYRRIGLLGAADQTRVLGYIAGISTFQADGPDAPIDVLNYEHAEGLGDAFWLSAEQVIDALEERTITPEKLRSLVLSRR